MTDELYPAYLALIRHELGLRAGSDALAELGARLAPADPAVNPPFRAPGIVRLRRGLRNLQRKRTPDESLDNFAVDLRFLRQFSNEEPVLSGEAMDRLLDDVMEAKPSRKAPRLDSVPEATTDPATVIPFPRKTGDTGGDA